MLYELASNTTSRRARRGSAEVRLADQPPATAGPNRPAVAAAARAMPVWPACSATPIATSPTVNAASETVSGAPERPRSIQRPSSGPPRAADTASSPNAAAPSPSPRANANSRSAGPAISSPIRDARAPAGTIDDR